MSEVHLISSAQAMERHHADYSNPLDVMLVCRQCNVNLGEGKIPENLLFA